MKKKSFTIKYSLHIHSANTINNRRAVAPTRPLFAIPFSSALQNALRHSLELSSLTSLLHQRGFFLGVVPIPRWATTCARIVIFPAGDPRLSRDALSTERPQTDATDSVIIEYGCANPPCERSSPCVRQRKRASLASLVYARPHTHTHTHDFPRRSACLAYAKLAYDRFYLAPYDALLMDLTDQTARLRQRHFILH